MNREWDKIAKYGAVSHLSYPTRGPFRAQKGHLGGQNSKVLGKLFSWTTFDDKFISGKYFHMNI